MKKSDKQLLEYYRKLPAEQGKMLLDFAEFLISRLPETNRPVADPLVIPRPDEETVIAAVKRLSATYPMLDKDKMLNETSALVAENLMQGRGSKDVINDLETVFRRHYEILLTEDRST